ncbi:MAG: hypothetical protein WDN69_18290 [Aliidongia sp.]
MSKRSDPEAAATTSGAVNWDPPAKRDLVERALADGMTDPAKIVEWANNYKVNLTVEEVLSLTAELKK